MVEKGIPANERSFAYSLIKHCHDPESKSALLVALTSVRASTDTTATFMAISYLMHVLDGDVFANILVTAGDKAASVQARVAAFMTFAVVLDPSADARYSRFIQPDPADRTIWGGCTLRGADGVQTELGAVPMPADFRAQIRTGARRVRDDPSEPLQVRSAAVCLG